MWGKRTTKDMLIEPFEPVRSSRGRETLEINLHLHVKQRKLKNVKATTWIWLRWYMASTQSVNKQIMPRI